MNTNSTRRSTFGAWLEAEIKHAGHNQRSFADAVGVSHVTVGRWIKGRPPHAKYIDAIADVLLLDYDEVAERAGYRPKMPQDRMDALHARYDRYLIRLEEADLAHLDRYLNWMATEADTKRSRQRRRQRHSSSERTSTPPGAVPES